MHDAVPSPTLSRLRTTTSIPDLDTYVRDGGLVGLRAARALPPDEVIDLVTVAGLRGRGGAGFPTGRKWRSVRDAAVGETFVVANAAEGEPATFKDRWLLRRNPYQVLEGLAIAAHAVGATTVFLALKSRFETEVDAAERARAELRGSGWLDDLDVQFVRGPDAYLFGEETAMLEVIEGRDPLPRVLPPYRVGLFGTRRGNNATVVNNAETLAHVATILGDGPDEFRTVGTADAPGTMLFTICGDVGDAHVVELALGTSLRELVEVRGRGVGQGREVQAVFPGASAAVLTADALDTPLTWEGMAEAGSALGSGGFAVYDDGACIVATTLAFTRFLATSSCGQCPACPRGCDEITSALHLIEDGLGDGDEVDRIRARLRSITAGSRCGLPVGAQRLVASVVDRFGSTIEEHLGTPCEASRSRSLPMITGVDDETGTLIAGEHVTVGVR